MKEENVMIEKSSMAPVVIPTPICDIVAGRPHLNALKKEDVIDIELVPLTPEHARIEIQMCTEHLRLVDSATGLPNQLSDTFIEAIAVAAFDVLFNKASNMHIAGANYITGLKIHFALFNNKFRPVYQPLYIKRPTGSQNDFNISEGQHYVYDKVNNIFELAASDEFECTTAYQKFIRIKHENELNHDIFRVGEDVEAVIFPFQTIYTLIHKNPTIDYVHLHNAIRQESEIGIKHCVLLSPQLMPEIVYNDNKNKGLAEPVNLLGKYANRSHLCPPHCDIINYTISSPGPTICPTE